MNEKKPEWKWLEDNQKMPIEYPDESEIQLQKEIILKCALPEKESLAKRLKTMYYGPGLKIIFYHCTTIWLILFLLYLGALVLCLGNQETKQTQMSIVFFAFPALYLGFSYLSCLLDEQQEMVELINSMHYSMHYIVNLRMLYASFISIGVNLVILFFIGGGTDMVLWKICALGVTSMCLFAITALYLYHHFSKSYVIGILLGVWAMIAFCSIWSNYRWIRYLLVKLPLAFHIILATGFFIGFMILTGKVEKEHVNSIAYQ